MARKRMIDPEFFLNEKLASVKAHSRLLYIGLWGLADDNYATLPNRPEWIKAQIFPYEQVDIKLHLKELEKIGDIVLFKHEDFEYWYIPSFFIYQRVERPSKPKYPEYNNTQRVLGEYSTNTPAEVKLSKEKLSKVKYSEYVHLFESEYNKLIEIHGKDSTQKMIEILDNYKGAHGKKYASDYRAILNWVVKRVQEEKVLTKLEKTPEQLLNERKIATEEYLKRHPEHKAIIEAKQ